MLLMENLTFARIFSQEIEVELSWDKTHGLSEGDESGFGYMFFKRRNQERGNQKITKLTSEYFKKQYTSSLERTVPSFDSNYVSSLTIDSFCLTESTERNKKRILKATHSIYLLICTSNIFFNGERKPKSNKTSERGNKGATESISTEDIFILFQITTLINLRRHVLHLNRRRLDR
jgi:hypothetical protein